MTRPYVPEKAPDRFISFFDGCKCSEPWGGFYSKAGLEPYQQKDISGHCPYCYRDIRLDPVKGIPGTQCECGRHAIEYAETHQDVRLEYWARRDEGAEAALVAAGWETMMWCIENHTTYAAMYYRPKDAQ